MVLVTYIKSIIYETIGYIRARSFRMNLNGIISENSIATPVSRDMVKYNSSGNDTKKNSGAPLTDNTSLLHSFISGEQICRLFNRNIIIDNYISEWPNIDKLHSRQKSEKHEQ